MFKDDISQIADGCAEYDGKNIYVFDAAQGTRKRYNLNGRTWFLTQVEQSETWPSVCFDLQNLNSNARLSPFYGMAALALVLIVFSAVAKIFRNIWGMHV